MQYEYLFRDFHHKAFFPEQSQHKICYKCWYIMKHNTAYEIMKGPTFKTKRRIPVNMKCIQGWLFFTIFQLLQHYGHLGNFLFPLLFRNRKAPPSMWVGRVTSWLNLGLEKEELTSLLGFLSGHALKSPMTSVVFLKSMNSFKNFKIWLLLCWKCRLTEMSPKERGLSEGDSNWPEKEISMMLYCTSRQIKNIWF